MSKLNHARTCVYNVGYHIVWSTKYRKPVLVDDVMVSLKKYIENQKKKCVDTKKCGFQYSRDHQSCLNFIKKFESALWRCLVDKDNLPTRSKHKTLSPFACKTQSYRYQL